MHYQKNLVDSYLENMELKMVLKRICAKHLDKQMKSEAMLPG